MANYSNGFLHPIHKRSRAERISEWWQSMYPTSRWTIQLTMLALLVVIFGVVAQAYDPCRGDACVQDEMYHVAGVEYADAQVFDPGDLIWLGESTECATGCDWSRMEVVLYYDPVQDQYGMTWATAAAFVRWLQTDFGPDVETELFAIAEFTLSEIDPAGEIIAIGSLPRYKVLSLMYEMGVDDPVAFIVGHDRGQIARVLSVWVYPYMVALELGTQSVHPNLHIIAELDVGVPI